MEEQETGEQKPSAPTAARRGAGRVAPGGYSEYQPLLSIAEYRKLLKDQITSHKRIQERIDYMERVIRNIIRTELDRYGGTDE